jgi:hypothetical protein
MLEFLFYNNKLIKYILLIAYGFEVLFLKKISLTSYLVITLTK